MLLVKKGFPLKYSNQYNAEYHNHSQSTGNSCLNRAQHNRGRRDFEAQVAEEDLGELPRGIELDVQLNWEERPERPASWLRFASKFSWSIMVNPPYTLMCLMLNLHILTSLEVNHQKYENI